MGLEEDDGSVYYHTNHLHFPAELLGTVRLAHSKTTVAL